MSVQELSKIVAKSGGLSVKDFWASYPTHFYLAESNLVFDISMRSGWMSIAQDSNIVLSPLGTKVLFNDSPQLLLRRQLESLITSLQPSWSKLIHKGRAETLPFLRENEKQCLLEAGLLDSDDYSVVAWWDALSSASRGLRNDIKTETGRLGELLSIDYETRRVGIKPSWQAIESNLSGYDILSRLDEECKASLLIEVKATENNPKHASFYVSVNEWETALSSDNYLFHLWLLKPKKKLRILTPQELGPHIAANRGDGEWQVVKLPFGSFFHD